MTDASTPRRGASALWVLTGATLLITIGLVACDDAGGQCRGEIQVQCDGLDDCWCAAGSNEGESCLYDLESYEPEVCEVKCCGDATPTVPGPPSILRGTK